MHTTNNWKWITILLPFLWTFTNCESILPLHHNCGGTFSLKEETVILEFKSSDVSKIVRYCSLTLNIPSGYEVSGKFHKINLNSDSKVNCNLIDLLCITKKYVDAFQNCVNYFQFNRKRYCEKNNNTKEFNFKGTSVQLGVWVSNHTFQPYLKLHLKLITIKKSSLSKVVETVILLVAILALYALQACFKLKYFETERAYQSSNPQSAQIIHTRSSVSSVPVIPFNTQSNDLYLSPTYLTAAADERLHYPYHYYRMLESFYSRHNNHFNSNPVTIDPPVISEISSEERPAEDTQDLPPNYDRAIIDSLNDPPSYESVHDQRH